MADEQSQDRSSGADEAERARDGSGWREPLRQSEAFRGNQEPEPKAVPKGASGEHWTPAHGTEHDSDGDQPA